MTTKYHAGTHLPRTLKRGGAKPEATTSGQHHGGTLHVKGVTHSPPAVGGAVNRGGTFGMGTLKKRGK
jgi:hypothetical protein